MPRLRLGCDHAHVANEKSSICKANASLRIICVQGKQRRIMAASVQRTVIILRLHLLHADAAIGLQHVHGRI